MTTTPSIDGVPLAEVEILDCRCADGAIVKAKARKDLPWPAIFMGRHPEHGLCFFRVRRRGPPNSHPEPGCELGEIEVWECTEAVRRCLQRRRERDSEAAKEAAPPPLASRARNGAKPGAPTPERRKRAAEQGLPIARVAAPDREGKASAQAMVYQAPDNIERLHRNGTITSNMKHAAARFHADWVMAGLEGLRAAKLERLPRGTGGIDGQAEATLDARNRVHRVYDRLGGYGQPGTQVLISVVGEGQTLAAWALKERSGPWRLDPHKAAGVLLSALGVLEGFYRPHPKAPESGS